MNTTAYKCILIRHGEKTHDNKSRVPLRFDAELTQQGIHTTYELAHKLMVQYGTPDYIIVSPYRRTKQTAHIIAEITQCKEIVIDPDVSEYISANYDPNTYALGFTPETLQYNPPLGETLSQFNDRAIQVYEKLKAIQGHVFVICHGYLISKVAGIDTGTRYGKVHELDTYVMQ